MRPERRRAVPAFSVTHARGRSMEGGQIMMAQSMVGCHVQYDHSESKLEMHNGGRLGIILWRLPKYDLRNMSVAVPSTRPFYKE